MHFISDVHEGNYRLLESKWSDMAKGNKEYVAAGYILAAPLIFERLQQHWKAFDTPIVWIFDWEMKNNPSFHFAATMSDEEKSAIQIDFDLTHSMVELGKLAMHLWNNTPFSLLDCLSCLDENNYNIAINAILLRTHKGK